MNKGAPMKKLAIILLSALAFPAGAFAHASVSPAVGVAKSSEV